MTATNPRLLGGTHRFSEDELIFDLVAIGCVALLIPVIGMHWRRGHLGNDEVQLALVFAAATCIAALTALEHGVFAHVSWWDYHAYLLAGFGCTAYALWTRGRRARAVTDVLDPILLDAYGLTEREIEIFARVFSDHLLDGFHAAVHRSD